MTFECQFWDPDTGEERVVLVRLTDAEVASAQRDPPNAEVMKAAFALRHAYREVPKGFRHVPFGQSEKRETMQ